MNNENRILLKQFFFLKWWLIESLVLEKKVKTCPKRIAYFPLMYFLIHFGPWMSILVHFLIPCWILSIQTSPITKFLIDLLKFICGLCFRFGPLSLSFYFHSLFHACLCTHLQDHTRFTHTWCFGWATTCHS